MNGNEYLKYKTYIDDKNNNFWKVNIKSKKTLGIIIIIGSLCGLLLIPLIMEAFNPPKVIGWGYSTIFNVTIHNALIVWLAVTIGIAWVMHGFGFILVRG